VLSSKNGVWEICHKCIDILWPYIRINTVTEILRSKKSNKVKLPQTGRGGVQSCEMLRIPNYVESQFTDRGKVVNLKHRPRFTLRKIPGTHFCQRLSQLKGLVRPEGLGTYEKKKITLSGLEHVTF
jgi:hypothetical protein